MKRTNDLLLEFISPTGEYKLTFDDDGKVAYAYLKKGDEIVGDVWLYNRCSTPEEPEWRDRTKIPFANSKAYMMKGGRLRRQISADDVQVNWEYEDGRPVAYVYILEDLYGVVGAGDKPGYARFATRDSRLAKVMVIED